MSEIRVNRSESGDILIQDLPPSFVWALRKLPELLDNNAPGMDARLSPNPRGGDDEAAREWDRNVNPELRHLFISARDLVFEDLTSLDRDPAGAPLWSIRIPAGNHTAWLSALAAARVALGDVHDVGPDDLSGELPSDLEDERQNAILLIQLLGWLQGMLIDQG